MSSTSVAFTLIYYIQYMYIHYTYPVFHTSLMSLTSVSFTLIYYIQYMYIHYTVTTYIPLYDGFPDVSPLEGRHGG